MIAFLSIIPRMSLFLLLVFAPLARGAVQDWAVTAIHLATLSAAAAFFLEKAHAWQWHWIKTPLDLPILALVGLSLLSLLFSAHYPTSFKAVLWLFNILGIFYLTIHTIRTRAQIRRLIYVVVGVGMFLSVFGMAKVSGNNPFFWWRYPEITQNVDRLSATYGNANHLAGYMGMAIPLAFGLLLAAKRRFQKVFLLSALLLLSVALILSRSRGGWIGALAGMCVMAAWLFPKIGGTRKKWALGLIPAAAVAAMIILSSTPTVERIIALKEQEGLSERTYVWRGAVQMIRDYPLTGAGPGMFSLIYTQYQPPGLDKRYFNAHNDYLQFVSETGVLLIPLMIWAVAAIFKKGSRKLKSPSRLVRGTTVGAMAGIAAILVHGLIDFNLHIPANALLFAVLAALTVCPQPIESRKAEDR